MNDIYFYKPDDKIKYINDCDLWVVARLVDVVNEKKEVTKWMEPFWLSADNKNGIGLFVSRVDAEILVQHMKQNNEFWKAYPLHEFNIKQMMMDCKSLTRSNEYNFIFSFGFWTDNNGHLINNKHCLSQSLITESFNVDSRYERDEHIVIRFSDENLNFIYSCWDNKAEINTEYKKYLTSVNQLNGNTCEEEALLALSKIIITPKDKTFNPDIAAIWSVSEKKWIYSILNNSIN